MLDLLSELGVAVDLSGRYHQILRFQYAIHVYVKQSENKVLSCPGVSTEHLVVKPINELL